jgi:hemerythrin
MIALRSAIEWKIDWVELDRVLTELSYCVQSHFDFEETGGYMREVLRRLPHRQEVVDALIMEHQLMTVQLRELRHWAIDREDPDGIRAKVGEWLDLLSRHESMENQLMLDAFNVEVGGGD